MILRIVSSALKVAKQNRVYLILLIVKKGIANGHKTISQLLLNLWNEALITFINE